ncbi:hypothetical protein GCM10009563_07240 [Subtercola frigoramans]
MSLVAPDFVEPDPGGATGEDAAGIGGGAAMPHENDCGHAPEPNRGVLGTVFAARRWGTCEARCRRRQLLHNGLV